MARTTRYQTAPLKTNGSSYSSRSIPVSAQRSLNLYPEATLDGISASVMYSWPYQAAFFSGEVFTESKGMYFWRNNLYVVVEGELREFSQDGTYEVVGSISVSVERVKFTNNSEVMLICAGGSPYQYDGSTLDRLTSITFNPTFPSFLNERFYLNSDDGSINVSDVISTNFDVANIFYGRSNPDETTSQYVFNQVIYLFSSGSIEPWQDVGTGAPPVSRIDQGIVEGVGLLCPYGVTNTVNYMYFIGSDGHPYRVSSFAAEDVGNPVISSHFYELDLTAVDANSVSFDGHKFVVFDFYRDGETWVYSETSNAWFELASFESSVGGSDGEIPYKYFNFTVGWNNRIYAISKEKTDIIYLSNSTYPDEGEPFHRERTISCISGDDFGEAGQLLEMSSILFSVETGQGPEYEDFENPILEVIPSFDGGVTWGRSEFLKLGTRGDYTLPVEYYKMKVFRRAVFKLRITAPVIQFTLYSASMKIRKAGY